MSMIPPRGKIEWNLNTVVVLIGFAAGLVAWGATLQMLVSGREQNAANIDRLEARISVLETTGRVLDNHELRIARTEEQVIDASVLIRDVGEAVTSLASDMRVTREILERLERQAPSRTP